MNKAINTLFLFVWFTAILPLGLYGQISSRNGIALSSSGTVRVLLIFGEVINDPDYNKETFSSWPPDQMPADPGYMLDTLINSSNIHGKLSKLFYEASFGEFVVIGDYVNSLMRIDTNSWNNSMGEIVGNYLNGIPADDITTAHQYTFNGSDFDNWQHNSIQGGVKTPGMDDKIDLIIVLWRVNSKFRDECNSCGTVFSLLNPVKGKAGSEYGSVTTAYSGTEWGAVRHEIAHSLLGSDAFATGGHVGNSGRTTIPKQGGYSLLNYAHGASGTLYNGFDRWRLGWKHPSKQYYISALDATTLTTVNTDLVYMAGIQYHDYILRDFVSTGDVIRIKLDYLKSEDSSTRNQYLWLENHQMVSELDLNKRDAKGIYAYIQVGWDDMTNFTDNGDKQYLTFLHGMGNYDMIYGADSTIYLNSVRQNPFTGYSMIQGLAYNIVNPNIINGVSYPDKIFADEAFYATGVVKDGIPLPSSDYSLPCQPSFGTIHDPFLAGSKIGIGSNPSTNPVLTYSVRDKKLVPFLTPQPADNKKIYLNGLSFEVLEYQANGDAKVRISYRDFDINNDVRWCGPIVLTERVELTAGTITLDQGLTPTRPVNPIQFNGEDIYASPTIFTAKAQGYYKMFAGTQTVVKNNSSYVSEQYGSMEINDQSPFIVRTGSTLVLKTGSNLLIKATGHIEVESGGYICIETGAHITLQDPLSAINFRTGHLSGFNPVSGLTGCNCLSNPEGAAVTGSGEIHSAFSSNFFIQNQTIGTDEYYTGNNISIGRAVDPSQNPGDVIIQSGTNVILDAQSNILLDVGLTINAGAGFEMR
jgi:hypothetical protein